MNSLTNFLTVLALACGFASLIFSLEGQPASSAWAIILAVIFDGLDGQLARRNPLPGEFGKELDSLADLVCFGVAPAILGYVFVYREFYFLSALALFIYLASSVFRLATYNITPKEKLNAYFYGLPTTVSGGIIASLILLYHKYTKLPSPMLFLFVILVLAFLMASRVRYLNLDALRHMLGGKKLSFLIIAALAGLVYDPQLTIFLLFAVYVFGAPFWAGRFIRL